MSDAYAQERKEKRWLVFQKVYVEYDGQLIEPGGNHPLQVLITPAKYDSQEDTYTPAVAIPVTGDPWVLVDEIGSFDLAKQKVIELAKDIGLNKVNLSRAVDLHTVLYPIA